MVDSGSKPTDHRPRRCRTPTAVTQTFLAINQRRKELEEKANEHVKETRRQRTIKDLRSRISDGLTRATGREDIRMSYSDFFESIVKKHHVDIVGWPTDSRIPFQDPSLYTAVERDVLSSLWATGKIFFQKLSKAEYKRRIKVRRLPDRRKVPRKKTRKIPDFEGTRVTRTNPYTRGRTKKVQDAGRGLLTPHNCEETEAEMS